MRPTLDVPPQTPIGPFSGSSDEVVFTSTDWQRAPGIQASSVRVAGKPKIALHRPQPGLEANPTRGTGAETPRSHAAMVQVPTSRMASATRLSARPPSPRPYQLHDFIVFFHTREGTTANVMQSGARLRKPVLRQDCDRRRARIRVPPYNSGYPIGDEDRFRCAGS